MRKEADDTGPLAELEHWRFLMARFHSILEQIKSKKCKMVISTLNAAKSKVLKVGVLCNFRRNILSLKYSFLNAFDEILSQNEL